MKKLAFLLAVPALVLSTSCEENGNFTAISSNNGATAGDKYIHYGENPFLNTADHPVSTFSIDADGASYANSRRYIVQEETLPPTEAVRAEEFLNYFQMGYPYDDPSHPINLNGEVSTCPWAPDHRLIRVGIKGKPIPEAALPNSNYVFLIDVSGSMSSEDKLPLLKEGFKRMVNEMKRKDKVAIVTYAGSGKIVLRSSWVSNKDDIIDAIDGLSAGGSTAGEAGINEAYDLAETSFMPNGNNRIILATDGDFNVGISDHDELIDLIERKRDKGIFLTVLGVGRGNLNEASLEQIANHGNGTYEYIDRVPQLEKVFIHEYGKFFTVAKDVKVQVEFNPNVVSSYRLIGYENRVLNEEDFADDNKDAGEIGANQDITALYEIVTTTQPQPKFTPTFTIDVRYKEPDSDVSVPMELEIVDRGNTFEESSDWMRFSASVACFAMNLSSSQYIGTGTYDQSLEWLATTNLTDTHGFIRELEAIIKIAKGL